MAYGMLGPQPEIEAVSPALEGRFSTTGPLGKSLNLPLKEGSPRDFPDGPVVKTPHFHTEGESLIPGQGTNISHALWPPQKKKKKMP